ncbi:MAG: tripartite tricarboxylate transporter substrate binding protein [Desulfobacterales bacterium]|nr:tripartite tricarboxylate transporter substrate binding protein [Desulfobacterales bacterium]
MNRLKLGVVVVLAMGFLWQSATTVLAEDKYPSKQINWYIHSSAGGGTDIFSRTVALRLRRILKANIVISTMSGGSGARMLNYLMEQPADGYTLNSFTNSNLATMARGMTTASRDDVIGIVRGCYDPQSLVISSKDGGTYKNIEEVLAKAKESPGKVKIGVAHMASIDHVASYEFGKAAGVEFEFVPFDGGGEIIVALLGNVIDMGVLNPSEFMGQYEAGNLIPAVFLVADRLKGFPDTPTAKELGYDVEMATWRGVVVKKGTPDAIVKTLRDAFAKSMSHKIYKNYLEDNSMGPESILIGADWDAFLDSKWPIWQTAMKDLGYIKK